MSVLTTLIQAIFARLYAIKPEGKWGKEKGATALEYIVLAAAIIIIVTVLATNTAVQTALTNAFTGLFSDAANPE